eukprot:GHVN01071084.1.p1 GENE.GHVN01071084.1~~GHVN01071084.1.p1  ORF type:complete len:118 (-),score=3.64 GHVN01071084.1:89-442(-)
MMDLHPIAQPQTSPAYIAPVAYTPAPTSPRRGFRGWLMHILQLFLERVRGKSAQKLTTTMDLNSISPTSTEASPTAPQNDFIAPEPSTPASTPASTQSASTRFRGWLILILILSVME